MGRALLFAFFAGVLLSSLPAMAAPASGKPTTTGLSISQPVVSYGDNDTYTATVSSSGGGKITGTVQFTTNGPVIGNAPVSGPSAYALANPVKYPAQLAVLDIASADFNGDGFADLAVVNLCGSTTPCNGNGSISILINNGDGTFHAGQTIATEVGTSSVTAADFNGDGHIDIAATNSSSGTVSLALGTGTGTFGAPISIRSLPNADFIRSGVFTASGRIDMVVVSTARNQIAVMVNNGGGSFGAPIAQATGANPLSLVVGDFDKDGLTDVAVLIQGNPVSQPLLSVFRGKGNGSFQVAQSANVGTAPRSIAAGDFNEDGILDVAVSEVTSGSVKIYLGNGDGTFQTPVLFSASKNVGNIVVADFNTDGHLDIAAADDAAKTVSVLLGKGDGNFDPPGTSPVAQANVLQWAFSNVVFNDSGTVTGYFTYNPAVDLFSDWKFTSAGGNVATFPPTTWLPSNSTPNTFGPGVGAGTYQWTDQLVANHQIRFKFNGSLATPGSLGLVIGDPFGNSECFNCSPFRSMTSGAASSLSSAFVLVAADFNGGGLPDIATTDIGGVSVMMGSQSVTAVLNDNLLPVGFYPVTATYSGDANFAGSASPTSNVQVLQAIPNIVASSDTPVALFTDTVTLRAHVSAAVGKPTGSVFFLNTDTTLGSGLLDANGDVAIVIPASSIGVGGFAITAFYQSDQNFTPNSTVFPQVVNPVADLSVSVIPPATLVAPGAAFNYVVSVANQGPQPATNAIVTVTLPAGLTVLAASPSCSGTFPQFVCNIGFVNSQSSQFVAIGVMAPLAGTYSAAATVSNTNEVDLNMANNVSAAAANVNGADLVLTAASAPINSGGNTAYTVKITNQGPANATGVILTDVLTRYGFVDATSTQGTCSFDGIQVSCAIGNMNLGASVTVTVKVAAPTSGWADNEFHVHANEPDSNPSNNAANLDPTAKAGVAPVLLTRPSRTPTKVATTPTATPKPTTTVSRPARATAVQSAPSSSGTTPAAAPPAPSPVVSPVRIGRRGRI